MHIQLHIQQIMIVFLQTGSIIVFETIQFCEACRSLFALPKGVRQHTRQSANMAVVKCGKHERQSGGSKNLKRIAQTAAVHGRVLQVK